jgi:hypothetical protein
LYVNRGDVCTGGFHTYTEMRLVCCTPAARGLQAVWWRQLNNLNGTVQTTKFENTFCLVVGLT